MANLNWDSATTWDTASYTWDGVLLGAWDLSALLFRPKRARLTDKDSMEKEQPSSLTGGWHRRRRGLI